MYDLVIWTCSSCKCNLEKPDRQEIDNVSQSVAGENEDLLMHDTESAGEGEGEVTLYTNDEDWKMAEGGSLASEDVFCNH